MTELEIDRNPKRFGCRHRDRRGAAVKRAVHAAALTFGLACAAVAVTSAGVLRGLPLTDAQRARSARLKADMVAWLDEHDPAGVVISK